MPCYHFSDGKMLPKTLCGHLFGPNDVKVFYFEDLDCLACAEEWARQEPSLMDAKRMAHLQKLRALAGTTAAPKPVVHFRELGSSAMMCGVRVGDPDSDHSLDAANTTCVKCVGNFITSHGYPQPGSRLDVPFKKVFADNPGLCAEGMGARESWCGKPTYSVRVWTECTCLDCLNAGAAQHSWAKKQLAFVGDVLKAKPAKPPRPGAKAISEYPHKCPRCSGPAYQGFNVMVVCQKGCKIL